MPKTCSRCGQSKPLSAFYHRRPRPAHDAYYMNIAFAVRERSNCLGSRVGAVLVFENLIISTGYKGGPLRERTTATRAGAIAA